MFNLKVESPTYIKAYCNRIYTIHYANPFCKGHCRETTIDYSVKSDEYLRPGETEVSYW